MKKKGRKSTKTETGALNEAKKVLSALKRETEKLIHWMDTLTEMDRQNFVTLINLQNAATLIEQCPGGRYKEMALLAYRFRKQLNLLDRSKGTLDSFLGDEK